MNPPPGTEDTQWAGDARAAVGIAAGFPSLLVVVDTAAGFVTVLRASLWIGLGLVLLAVLWPTKVSAAPGLLTARGLVRRHHVHTDRLASVTWHNGIAQRLLLEDIDGNRAEVDPRVFVANPAAIRYLCVLMCWRISSASSCGCCSGIQWVASSSR
ncbi:hypothetical protein M8Z33_25940 [Streptomyces sp. ZAF1911]|uniref:hypothetical protein n=1 Tax=Streptomyces sp. ZAF1911 TaxID=2944129 RepID=UPI00237AE796|nr:hypothetical protein [Streptomyces sp. ZAF1911]MDD9380036.1 hypothetical protein [Streptomyces sp. ZAF1911]